MSSPTTDLQLPEGAWQPIETAPKDGTIIDLWVHPYTGRAYRLCDYWWLKSGEIWRTHIRAHDLPKSLTPTHWRLPPAPPAIDAAGGSNGE